VTVFAAVRALNDNVNYDNKVDMADMVAIVASERKSPRNCLALF
jgi:hypothetical protein